MRIRFEVDGIEYQGQAEQISTLGAFVVSEHTSVPEELELTLEDNGTRLALTADVVRVTPQGFAVAFHAMAPEMLEKLDQLLSPGQAAPPADEPEIGEAPGEPDVFSVALEDWTPPVTEPILHHWKPEADLVPPPEEGPAGPAWESLPTLSPAVLKKAPTPTARAPKTEPAAERKLASSQAAPAAQPKPKPAPKPPAPPEPTPEPEIKTGAERRMSERIDQSFPIAFDTLTHLIKEFTHNISFGGMFVYTSRPMKKGEETAVTLVHPVHGERCTLLAKVVHSTDAPSPDPITGAARYGVGVEFRMPLDELKRVLSDFISSHQQPKEIAPSAQVVREARTLLQSGVQSHHQLLGVGQEAPLDEIRRAYFQLVDRFHPDRYFGKVSNTDLKVLEELFRQLTKAYEELTA